MRKTFSIMGLLLLLGAFLLVPGPASALDTLEIAFIADVSGSIDGTDYTLQKAGYQAAFNTVANLYNTPNTNVSPFYAMYGEWSNSTQQQVRVGWTLIDSAADATAFGTAIAGLTRAFDDLTAPQNALIWATDQIKNNGFTADRRIIDISGDGTPNSGFLNAEGRTYALANTINTINGVVIDNPVGGAVYNYYLNNVIGGGGLLFQADTFSAFGAAMSQKITYETTGVLVPLPGALLLLGGGLFRLAGYGLRRQKTS